MKKVLTIWAKEFKAYFSGPGFYVVTGIYLLFLSYTYLLQLKHFTEKSIRMMYMMQGQGGGLNLHQEVFMSLIGTVNLVMLFLIPFITVRLLAEEKKSRTFDLLLTSPITSFEIVIGKFLAALSVAWLLCLISLIYPLSIMKFAEIQWGLLASSYVGLLLIVAMYVAVGIFASSLTQSNILSGFVAIILSFGLWFVAWTTVAIDDPFWTQVFEHLSVAQHFGKFTMGQLQVSGIVFALSIIAIFCFLAERVVESARWRA